MRLCAATLRITAGALYKGRAFVEATRAARLAGSPLLVISAGVGLVSEEDAIPSYSLTISSDQDDSIARRITKGEVFLPGKWWGALHSSGISRRCLAEEITDSKNRLFVLALSPVYLGLIVEELQGLMARDLERVRLIGPRRLSDVPEGLRHIYMPYDGRLDGPQSPIRGTESDFPQRAGRHFVDLLKTVTRATSIQGHRDAVQKAIGAWPYKVALSRQRLPEAQLRKVIKVVLRETNGQVSKALRRLRDDLDIACEQKRFQNICREILEGRNNYGQE